MTTGQWVLVVAVVLAVALGVWRRRTDGRFRPARAVADARPAAADVPEVPTDVQAEPGPREAVDAESLESGAVPAEPSLLFGTPFADQLGERATFLQFSSAFCAPCRVTRRILEEVTALVPGVAHVEVDAELHLDMVRRVDVLRTPTTIVLDAAGREVTRAAGAPTKQQVIGALALVVSPDAGQA